MKVKHLLKKLRDLGAVLVLDGDRLRIEAPRGVITEELRKQLKDDKAEILETLQQQHDLVASMSLDQLARAGLIIRVHSSVLENDILFVSDNVQEVVVQQQQLPAYRAHELRKLASLRPEPHTLRSLHEIKNVFKGTIAAVEDRSDDDEAS